LGLPQWQVQRALHAGLIPPPDPATGRWAEDAVPADLEGFRARVSAEVGSVPDVGAGRAAQVLSARLGMVVTPDGVRELAYRGLIGQVGWYKHHPLYDGQALEAFTDTAAATEATWAGQLRTATSAAAYLRIRRSDFDHLTRAGLLKPAEWGRGVWDRRGAFSVPLYRTGDLDALAARSDIDWAAVRATRPGHRSPLATLPTAAGRGRR
jgi:hypothetical protein